MEEKIPTYEETQPVEDKIPTYEETQPVEDKIPTYEETVAVDEVDSSSKKKGNGVSPVSGGTSSLGALPTKEEALNAVVAKSQAGYINPDLEDFNKPQVDRQTTKKDTSVDDLVLRTKVLRDMRNASVEKAKALPAEVERLKKEGEDLISQYQSQPSPQLEQTIRAKQAEYLQAEKAANRQALITEVYNRRLMETSDSIKKMANDQVPDGIYSAIYKGVKGIVKDTEKAIEMSRASKEEQIQWAKDEALKAPTTEPGMVEQGAEMVGGVIPDIATAIGFSLVGLPVAGVAAVSARQGAQQAGQDFVRAFNAAQEDGKNDDEAYDIATKAAGIGFATGAAEGLVGAATGHVGAKLASKAASKVTGKVIEKAVDTGLDATIAGTMQVGRNVFDRYQGLKTDISEGVAANMLWGIALSGPVNTYHGVSEYINDRKKSTADIIEAIKEQPKNPYKLDKLEQNVEVLKETNGIKESDYQRIKTRISTLKSQIESGVPEEKAIAVADREEKKVELTDVIKQGDTVLAKITETEPETPFEQAQQEVLVGKVKEEQKTAFDELKKIATEEIDEFGARKSIEAMLDKIANAIQPNIGNPEYVKSERERIKNNPLGNLDRMIDYLENNHIPQEKKENSSLLIYSERQLEELKDLKKEYLSVIEKESGSNPSVEQQVGVKPKEVKPEQLGSGVGGDVESTTNVFNETQKSNPTVWQKIKDAFYNVVGKVHEGFKNTQDFIDNAINGDTQFSELAKALKDKLGDIKTSFVDDLRNKEGKLAYGKHNKDGITVSRKSPHPLQTWFHEAVHKLTVDKLYDYEEGNLHKLSDKDIEAIQNLHRIFGNVQKILNDKGIETKQHNPFKNVREFVAEALTNPEFQEILNKFKGEGKSPTLLKQFLDAVSKLLGLKDGSILDDVFHHTENLFNEGKSEQKNIAEAYHDAKSKGIENDFTKAVEQSLPTQEAKVKEEPKEVGSVGVGGDVMPLEGYHYTDKDFTEFEQPTETQSLGNGTYFYLNKRKSTKREVTSELNVKKVLDWKELKDEERSTIIKELEKAKIPTDRLNDGKLIRKVFNNIDDAKKFSYDKKAEGLNVKTDLVDGEYIVEYKEKGLSNASNDKLRGLAAEFDPNIAKRLGYDAAKLGDEIVVFDVKNTKIKPVEQSLKETTRAETPTETITEKGVKEPIAENKPTEQEDVLKPFADIINERNSFEEAFDKVRSIKDVPQETADAFSQKYATEQGTSPQQAFRKFYNEVKGREAKQELQPIKELTFEEAKNEYEFKKEKYKKHLKKDGEFRANTPDEVKKEIGNAYSKMKTLVKQERERLVSEDKRDTGLFDGIDRIRNNNSAFNIVRMSMERGLIPERLYNEFGKNLLHIVADAKDVNEVTAQTAEIIQDFMNRENIKVDDVIARELQLAENLRFETKEEQTTTPKGNTSNVGGDVDFAKRKKEMQTEYDKLQKERFALAKERDEIIGGGEKYRTWGKKQTDEKINEIRGKQKEIDEKQTALQKELKVIEAKEKGSVELFDHYNSGTGSPNTIIYDIKNNKLLERENIVRGETKDISIEDAARNKFASTLRGRNEREINEAYTDKVKAKYEAEINEEIAKYKPVEQSLKETTKPKQVVLV